jgi:hypothetical protein
MTSLRMHNSPPYLNFNIYAAVGWLTQQQN